MPLARLLACFTPPLACLTFFRAALTLRFALRMAFLPDALSALALAFFSFLSARRSFFLATLTRFHVPATTIGPA